MRSILAIVLVVLMAGGVLARDQACQGGGRGPILPGPIADPAPAPEGVLIRPLKRLAQACGSCGAQECTSGSCAAQNCANGQCGAKAQPTPAQPTIDTKEISELKATIVRLEAQIKAMESKPGPQGPAGPAGKDGKDGSTPDVNVDVNQIAAAVLQIVEKNQKPAEIDPALIEKYAKLAVQKNLRISVEHLSSK